MKNHRILLFTCLASLLCAPAQAQTVWSDFAPQTHGSSALLEACFTKEKLAARKGERFTRKKGPGAYLKPPEIKRPKVVPARLKPEYYGSIRSVDVGGRKLVALGFDIGEQNNDFAGYDGEIIDTLRKYNIRSTLYLGGKWMATHPERTKQLIADPLFEIGNHAWTHGNFRVLGKSDVEDQIWFTQAEYEKQRAELANMNCAKPHMNSVPVRIATFRFPYGTCNDQSLKQVNDAGLPAVQWDIVTGDTSKAQSANAIERALLSVKPGSIVVAHANGRGWNTATALKSAIPKMLKQGWQFVTVTQLLEMGKPRIGSTCYENRPGDNTRYDRIFGRGTGE